MRGGRALALMVFGAAVVAGGILPAWWLLRGQMRELRPGDRITFGPPSEERATMPRRIGGLLQTQIRRGDGGRAADEPTETEPGPPERWGWADRERGLARMPIDRAIELVIERYGAAAQEGEPAATTEAAGEPVPVETGPPSLDEPVPLPQSPPEPPPPGGTR